MMYQVPWAGVDNVRLLADTGLVLINRDPEPDETRVPAGTNVTLWITDLDGVGVDLAQTKVYFNDVLVFNAGAFSEGYNGSIESLDSGLTLAITIAPDVDFTSREVVAVHVLSSQSAPEYHMVRPAEKLGYVAPPPSLDVTYSFTVQDTDGLQLDGVLGWAEQVVRVFYDYPVDQTLAGDPANYAITRQNVFPACAVNVRVVGARIVSDSVVDLDLDIPITFGAPYLLTISNVTDIDGWAFVPPANAATFAGWSPPTVVGRSFNMYGWFGAILRQQDQDQRRDMEALIGCWQEVVDLILYRIDHFNDINDPRLAPEKFVDAALFLLGNPFSWLAMDLPRKRRLMENLVSLYKLKGSDPGIEAALRLLLDLDATVEPYNRAGWRLGRSHLGHSRSMVPAKDGTYLSIGTVRGRNSFNIVMAEGIGNPLVNRALTAVEETQVRKIVNWMKPANMHLINIVSPNPTP